MIKIKNMKIKKIKDWDNISENNEESVKKRIENLLSFPIMNIYNNIVKEVKKVKHRKIKNVIDYEIIVGQLSLRDMGDIIEKELRNYEWVDYDRDYGSFLIRIKINERIWETPLIFNKYDDENDYNNYNSKRIKYSLWLNTGGYLVDRTEKVRKSIEQKYNL